MHLTLLSLNTGAGSSTQDANENVVEKRLHSGYDTPKRTNAPQPPGVNAGGNDLGDSKNAHFIKSHPALYIPRYIEV